MANDKVSIIVPVFNSEKFVEEAIQSVLCQTYTNWELILVNDGSTDSSSKICEMYGKAYAPQVRVINIDHSGVARARNIGTKSAVGGYLTYLDSDDIWEENFLAEIMAEFEQNPNMYFVYSGSDEFDQIGNILNVQDQYKSGKFNAFIHKSGELRLPFNMDSFVVKKDLIEKYNISFPEGYKISEDICFFLEILCVTQAYYVPKILTHYRRHSNSATTILWSADRWESTVSIFESAERYCCKYAPDLKKDFDIIRAYRTYGFVSSVLKNSDIASTIFYINKYSETLWQFVRIGKKINNRLKCFFMLTKNRIILKIISSL